MRKITWFIIILALCMSGCTQKNEVPKIGVSFGVGEAARWSQEKLFMEEHAQELGVDIEVRLNKDENEKSQKDDCFELIDSGVDVLIVTARDVYNMKDIIDYAHTKNVPVISYARLIMNESYELFVGYDSERMGQKLGQYLSETAISGDYLLLQGDETDYNAQLLYKGSMAYINKNEQDINIILDASVPKWSTEEAKKLIKPAIIANDNKVDAILAPNDQLAGACVETLVELGITTPVVITGMDAELDAVKRIVAGTQSCTIYMDLKALSYTAIEEAYKLAKGEKSNINSDFENNSGSPVPANLITGQLVTKENLNRILIDGGYYTKEEIYGTNEAVQ